MRGDCVDLGKTENFEDQFGFSENCLMELLAAHVMNRQCATGEAAQLPSAQGMVFGMAVR